MIAIIEGVGANIASVQYAIARLAKKAILTQDPRVIQEADYVILPGVGTAKHGMECLQALQLIELIPTLTQPVLGICLGMQLLFANSEEGNVTCLNIIPETIKDLSKQTDFIIPHMGWNQINLEKIEHPLFESLPKNSYVYFVHGYAAEKNKYTLARTNYGTEFSAIVNHNNFYGMQFHPERSGKVGEKLLENFLTI